MPVGNGNDLHASSGHPKDDDVGKPLEYHPSRAKCIPAALVLRWAYHSVAASASSKVLGVHANG
jgi:hypothetical protein